MTPRIATLLLFTTIGSVLCAAQAGLSDVETGVTEARARMNMLSPLVGSFALTASETATDDSSFQETGTRDCRWAVGDTMILCEDARALTKATGRYLRLPANRRSLRAYRWHAADRTFEQVDIGAAGLPQVRTLAFDAGRGTLSYMSVVQSQSRGETLDNTSVFTIGAERHLLTQTLRSRTSTFQEEYRETAVRR